MKNSIRELTRTLVVGATIGGAPVLTIGAAATVAGSVMAAPQSAEKQEIARIVASRDPQAVEEFLLMQGTSPYCAVLLNALPPRVLAQLSPYTIAGLSPETVSHLTRRTRATLAHTMNQGGAPAMAPAPAQPMIPSLIPNMEPEQEQEQPLFRSAPALKGDRSNASGGARGGY